MIDIPPELLPLIRPRSCPDRLEGTFAQIVYGESLRRSRLAVARRSHPELVDLLSNIRDSTWWIANRGRPLTDLRWPAPAQMAAPPGGGIAIDGRSSDDPACASDEAHGRASEGARHPADARHDLTGRAALPTPSDRDRHPDDEGTDVGHPTPSARP